MGHIISKPIFYSLLGLASGGVIGVGSCVETGTVGDLQLGVVEARVARHDSSRRVFEADRGGILEFVVDELGAVGLRDLNALETADDGVVLEEVVLGPSRVRHIGRVGSKVRVGVVPEQGRRYQQAVVGSPNYRRLHSIFCLRVHRTSQLLA